MRNVLMFYDDAILIDLVRISLEDKDLNILGFLNDKNILSKVDQYNPLAIILDLNFALELEKEIIEALKTNHIPTVIFSSDLNGRQNSEETGIDYFVRKSPSGFEELENVINEVLKKETAEA